MSLIRALRIRDFQAHKNRTIELDERITTIVGPSDIGKSVIVRALRWVCRNQPQGSEFIREGKKTATVRIEVDNQTIERSRGAANSYKLNDRVYSSFGSSVPDPINDILRVGDINFQNQHDAAFWFSLSAGEVSRQLNAIVDLGVIDESLAAALKRVRYHRQEYEICENRLKTAKERKDELKWVVDADVEYQAIERIGEERRSLVESVAGLSEHVSNVKLLKETQQTATQTLSALVVVGKFAKVARDAADFVHRLGADIQLIQNYQETVSIGFPDISQVERWRALYYRKEEELKELGNLILNIEGAVEGMMSYQKRKEEADEELRERTDGICPVCGKELN